MNRQDRAVTPVISTILMVAIVVILAAVIATFALGFAENFSDPAPTVGDTTGEFVPGADEQVVRITHVAGDSVPVEEIEIIVRASGPDVDTEARLVDLPSDQFGNRIEDENIEANDDLIEQGFGSPSSGLLEDDPDQWSAGDTLSFAIGVGEADFREGESPEADTLEVIIVHTPSNSILSEHTFTP